MQTCRAYHGIDVSSLHFPVEDIPPSEETVPLEIPNITSPDLDPHELEREVDDDDPTLEHDFTPRIDDVKTSLEYIRLLRTANLDSNIEPINSDLLSHIRNPPPGPVILTPDERLSVDIYLAMNNASEQTYNNARKAILRRYPDSKMLSFYQVKTRVKNLTGVMPIVRDMCINSCVRYTGMFTNSQSNNMN